MAVGPRLNWIKSQLKNKVSLIIFFIISLIISFLILRKLSSNLLVNTILFSSAFYLFFITVNDFLKKKFTNLSQQIAHFSFSLLILSILFNNILSSEIIANLKVGEEFHSKKNSIFFEKIEKNINSNFNSIVGHFKIKDNEGNEIYLTPELRIYNQPVTITSEASIKTNLIEDKFIVMNIIKDTDYFNVRYQVKPFMIWIWFSALLLSISGLLSLIKKYEK
jgi:cytochrome c-type biogenesis protein CcmF